MKRLFIAVTFLFFSFITKAQDSQADDKNRDERISLISDINKILTMQPRPTYRKITCDYCKDRGYRGLQDTWTVIYSTNSFMYDEAKKTYSLFSTKNKSSWSAQYGEMVRTAISFSVDDKDFKIFEKLDFIEGVCDIDLTSSSCKKITVKSELNGKVNVFTVYLSGLDYDAVSNFKTWIQRLGKIDN